MYSKLKILKNSPKNLLDNQGNVTLVGMVVTLLLTTLVLIVIKEMDRSHQKIKTRAQTYLCFRFVSTHTKKHIKTIGKSNKLITTAYLASKVPNPAVSVPAKASLIALVAAQSITIINYTKKLSMNKQCKGKQKILSLQAIPYNMFKRSLDRTVKLIKKRWSFTIPSSNILKNPLFLKGTFFVSGRHSTTAKLNIQEVDLNIFHM